ncbi:MAG TPA: sterol desaturase family protein [Polyangiaceae bacterium]|nr:sterol desaturase family protein [Polyangiaceae bacterium]
MRRWLFGCLRAGSLLALVILERAFPLRAAREPLPRRTLRNLSLGTVSFAVVRCIELPLVTRAADWAGKHELGVLFWLRAPRRMRALLSFLWLDYTLYLWHRATHQLPILWRLHAVHHSDRDLDLSTAARFHALEMLVSVPYRVLQVMLFGLHAGDVATWRGWLSASVLFHHSNLRLPYQLERALAVLLVTPRLHGLHHSELTHEQHGNWSSLLSLWDALHGSFAYPSRNAIHDVGVRGLSGSGFDELWLAQRDH